MWRKRINIAVIVLTSLLVVSVLFPMIQRSRETARRMQSRHNLKMIGLALQNYHDSYNGFPPGGVFNIEGRGYHSWMILILPFVENHPLYNSIDFNEPWDSTKNAGSFLSPIRLYENPSEPFPQRDKWEFPLAHYSANSHLLAVNSFTKVATIEKDGVTRVSTIENAGQIFLVGELAGDFVPWGCPYNWRELGSLNANPPTYGRSTRDGCQFVFVDGRVEFVANEVSPDIMNRMSGEDLTGFKANPLNIQRPSAFPVPVDALRIGWKQEAGERVAIWQDIHGKVTSDRIKRIKGSK